MKTYINWLLKHSKIVAFLLLLVVVGLVSQIYKFELDASSDSLVLENDSVLRYYQKIQKNYQNNNEFVVISYTPKEDLLADSTVARIKKLSDELNQLEQVVKITNIINVPLFLSPPLSLIGLSGKGVSIEKGNANKKLAKVELSTSPIYGSNLMSADGKTTAILVTLKQDKNYDTLRQQRDELRLIKAEKGLLKAQRAKLAQLEKQVSVANKVKNETRDKVIENIRRVMDNNRQGATLFLGGLPMIIADIVGYVRNDLVVFSIAVIFIMALILGLIFKTMRWVLVPIFASLVVSISMTGLLSLIGWKVTIISSNFFSMLLVMTLSIIIHLVVKYREVNQEEPNPDKTLKETIVSMAKPCLYTTVTTLIAFTSLLVSGIRPVIDFGLIMAVGVVMALIFSFIIFPLIIHVLPKLKVKPFKETTSFVGVLSNFTQNKTKTLLSITVFLIIFSTYGIFNLSVDNRFVDYFKKDTEIYQGLSVIDNQLGGTTSLEIIIDNVAEDYWFDKTLREEIHNIHTYLDKLPETGKVMSIDTLMQILTQANDGIPLKGFLLNIAKKNIPEKINKIIVSPYLSEKSGQIRFVIRLKETNPDLKRDVFLKQVKQHIIKEFSFNKNEVHLTGMVVLFNNMLQSLFDSQIKTMSLVFIMIFLVFSLLFRSFLVALLAILPNMLPAFLVLGVMGTFNIPLDLMTITIAAIAIGIGVDDAIHYIHRFKIEFKKDNDYIQSMHRTHQSTGLAMFYTSLVISFGFLVLVLSNFIPSIYFGVFTAIAMMAALLANLTLLPKLLIWLKPKMS
jgi:predicted RND superfamily exporter protein